MRRNYDKDTSRELVLITKIRIKGALKKITEIVTQLDRLDIEPLVDEFEDEIDSLKDMERELERISLDTSEAGEELLYRVRERLEKEHEEAQLDRCVICESPYMVLIGDNEVRGCSC